MAQQQCGQYRHSPKDNMWECSIQQAEEKTTVQSSIHFRLPLEAPVTTPDCEYFVVLFLSKHTCACTCAYRNALKDSANDNHGDMLSSGQDDSSDHEQDPAVPAQQKTYTV